MTCENLIAEWRLRSGVNADTAPWGATVDHPVLVEARTLSDCAAALESSLGLDKTHRESDADESGRRINNMFAALFVALGMAIVVGFFWIIAYGEVK